MPARAPAISFRDRLLAKSGEAFFRSGDSSATLKVDLAAGIIRGVALIVADREATGWFMWVDQTTVAQFATLLSGRKLKAYATHGDCGADGTLDEVGLWQNSTVDAAVLRSDFNALDAWRKHSEDEFDLLFELANKAPEEFGASLRFRYTLAWVRKNGEDVPTEICGWNSEDDCPLYDPSAPADALRSDMPSVRPVKVLSADFVDEGAATDGLFRSASVDAPGKGVPAASPAQLPPAPLMDIKTLQAEFGTKPAHLSRAVALFSSNDKLTVAELRATIATEEQGAELAMLRTADEKSKPEFAKIESAGFKAKDGKSAVDHLLAEHASFKTAADLRTAELATLKAAGFEIKEGKSATDLLLAAYNQKVADIATLRAGGTVPINTGAAPAAAGATAELHGLAQTRAAFNARITAKAANN